MWNFDLYLLYMEDNNILDYNQHQLMKGAPSLIIGPNPVSLALTRKGLRNPILKCKIILARNHMDLLHNQPLICTSISSYQLCRLSARHSHQHCCNTLLNLLCSRSLQYGFSIYVDQPLLIPLC